VVGEELAYLSVASRRRLRRHTVKLAKRGSAGRKQRSHRAPPGRAKELQALPRLHVAPGARSASVRRDPQAG
jgi:hypothetical protein